MSRELLFEYFLLYIPHCSMFNYLLNGKLLIKINLVFAELLNFKVLFHTTEIVGKRFSEFILILTG